MRRLLVALVVVLALVPGNAAASARGSPDLSASVADGTVAPGTDATLRVNLVNEGDLEDGSTRNPALNEEVTTARGVNVTLDASAAPFEVETRSRTVGRLPQGASPSLGFRLSVPEDAEPGTYAVPVTVEYTHTQLVAEETGARQSRDVERTFEVTVEVREAPRFRVVDVDHDVRVGATGTVDLTVENVGSAPARETAVAVRTDNGDLGVGGARSATRFAGAWDPGETRTVSYRVTAAPDAAPQRYAFTATASYETTDGDDGRSEPLGFAVRLGPEQRFAVEAVESDVAVGEAGDVSVTLRNTGTTVRDAAVELASSNGALRVDNASRATRFVGAWEPGETRTVEYGVQATRDADARSYALTATVAYRDADGDRRTRRAGSLGVALAPEQTFAYRNVSVTLRGSTARVTGQVENTGDRPVESAVVAAESVGDRVRVTDGTYPVGALEPGEAAPFSVELRVAPNAHPGPRELGLSVRYDGDSGRTYTSDPTSVRVPLRTDEDVFAVEPVNATLDVDSSNTVRVRIRNVGDDRLTDVRARFAVRDPYGSNNPTAYVASLAPGESTTVTFELTTPEDGVPTTDAVPLNVTADTPSDQRIEAGSYLVPVTVGGSEGPAQRVPFLAVGAAVVVLLAGGWWWLNR